MLGVRLLAIGSVVGASYGAITGAGGPAGQDVALIGGSALPALEVKAAAAATAGAPTANAGLWPAARADDLGRASTTRSGAAPQPLTRVEVLASPSISRVEIATDGRVRFAGLGSTGAEVSLRRNGEALGTTIVDASGNWQLEVERRLAAGEHRIEAVARSPGGSRTLPGSDVRIAIPRGFDLPQGPAGAPLVAFERSSDDIARERAAIEAEARRRFAQETAGAKGGSDAAPPRAAAPTLSAPAAPPAAPAPAVRGTGTPPQQPASDGGSGPWSVDGVLMQIQEWLAKANRDYQREIVRRLQIPAPPPETAGEPEARRQQAAKPAAEPAPKRESAPRPAAPVEPATPPAREDATAGDVAKEVRAAAERAEAERIAAEKAAAERAARDRVAAEKAASQRAAAEKAAAEKAAADRAAAEKAAAEKAAVEKAAAEKAAAEKAAAEKASQRAAAERAAAEKAAAEKAAAERAAAEKAATDKAAAEKAAAERAAAADRSRPSPSASSPPSAGPATDPAEVPAPERRPAVVAGRAEEGAPPRQPGPGPGREVPPLPEPRPTARAHQGGPPVVVAARESDDASASSRRETARAGRTGPRCRSRAGRRVTPPGTYTVATGDSLWQIASRHYGHGYFYPAIYRANAGKIDDPDLIYPCQRLFIPRRRR